MKTHIVSVWVKGRRYAFLVQAEDKVQLKLDELVAAANAAGANIKPGTGFCIGC